jgi:predicted DNA-binding transcriptional regulator YafY
MYDNGSKALEGILPNTKPDSIYVTPKGFDEKGRLVDPTKTDNKVFKEVFAHLSNRQRIQLCATFHVRCDLLYLKKTENMREVHRNVEPYEFSIKDHTLYLYAHCMLHGRIHNFIMANIQDVSILRTAKFTPRWPIKIPAFKEV